MKHVRLAPPGQAEVEPRKDESEEEFKDRMRRKACCRIIREMDCNAPGKAF